MKFYHKCLVAFVNSDINDIEIRPWFYKTKEKTKQDYNIVIMPVIHKKCFVKYYTNVRDDYTADNKFQLETLVDLDMCDFQT